MMLPLFTHLLCLFLLWPLLIRTFGGNTPAPVRPQPVARPIVRQLVLTALLGRRLVAVRVQLVAL